jgi:hypothetical protein
MRPFFLALLVGLGLISACGGAVETSKDGVGSGGQRSMAGDGDESASPVGGGSTSSTSSTSSGGSTPSAPQPPLDAGADACGSGELPRNFPVVDTSAFLSDCTADTDCPTGEVCLSWQGAHCVKAPACAIITCNCEVPYCHTDARGTTSQGTHSVICGSNPPP